MSEPIDMKRPPLSGPGSGIEQQKAFAVKLSGKPAEYFADMQRDEVIAFIDAYQAEEQPKEAPDGVEVLDEPVHKNAKGRPTWSVPVEGGYAAEHELLTAEREKSARDKEKAEQRAKQG